MKIEKQKWSSYQKEGSEILFKEYLELKNCFHCSSNSKKEIPDY